MTVSKVKESLTLAPLDTASEPPDTLEVYPSTCGAALELPIKLCELNPVDPESPSSASISLDDLRRILYILVVKRGCPSGRVLVWGKRGGGVQGVWGKR